MVACLSVSLFNNARKYKYEDLAKGMSIQPYQFEPEYSLSEENAEENFSGSEEHGINSLKPNRGRERVSRFDNVSKCVYERTLDARGFSLLERRNTTKRREKPLVQPVEFFENAGPM